MVQRIIGGFIVLLMLISFSVRSHAVDGDLFVQVDLQFGIENSISGCSIMKVTPAGGLSEFISNAQILALTGLAEADCQDTGLAIDTAGNVFFNEDTSDNIFMATPGGALSIFATAVQIAGATGGDNDIDNGMTFGPDGNLYVAEEDSNSILKIPVPLISAITQVVTEQEIMDLLGTPPGTVDLEGGIAIDPLHNIFFTNDDSGNDIVNVILKKSSAGVLSVLSPQHVIAAATGSTNIDLDVGIVLDDFLYVLDDGSCDCVLKVHTTSGAVAVYVTEEQITDATGNPTADVEGGIAVDEFGNLFIGDSHSAGPPDFISIENIVRADTSSQTSLFVSDAELTAFYAGVEPTADDLFLNGSMAIEGVSPTLLLVPTLSEWGLIAMAAILGIVGFMVARRRMVKA